MNKEDAINKIIAHLVDLTDGAFNVYFDSDGCGSHFMIDIEDHTNSQEIVRFFSNMRKELGYHLVVRKVPKGFIHPDETDTSIGAHR